MITRIAPSTENVIARAVFRADLDPPFELLGKSLAPVLMDELPLPVREEPPWASGVRRVDVGLGVERVAEREGDKEYVVTKASLTGS